MIPEDFDKYCQFIRVVTQRLNEHFASQKEYIFCKEGCSLCCENGEYPCTELEADFLKSGTILLNSEAKDKIFYNIEKCKADKNNYKGKKFHYVCPFLIDKKCSVYNFRPLICRVFGLSYYSELNEKREIKIPFCVEQGLNYSAVYDKDKDILSMEKFCSGGFKHEPLSTNLSPEFLKSKVGEDILGLNFGKEKPLLDWF